MSRRDLLAILRRGVPTRGDFAGLVEALARARADRDQAQAGEVLRRLAGALSALRACATLAGRLSLHQRPTETFAARLYEPPPEVIPVEFADALADLASRQPVVAHTLEAAAATVRAAYGPVVLADGTEIYPHGFALAKTIDVAVVERVQETVARALREGMSTQEATDEVAELGDWSRAYAETVVRTNTTTAYTAGRFTEAASIAETTGIDVLFRYSAITDSDVRPNHAAMAGIVAPWSDPIWDRLSPPLGFNCRCSVYPVFDEEPTPNALYTALGRGAKPDGPGFGSRPDRAGAF